MNKTNDRN